MSAIHLQIRAGQKVKELTFHRPQITIGRSPDCSVVMAVAWMGEQHIVLQKKGLEARVRTAGPEARATMAGRPVREEWMLVPPLGELQILGPQQEVITIGISVVASNEEGPIVRPDTPASSAEAPQAPNLVGAVKAGRGGAAAAARDDAKSAGWMSISFPVRGTH